MVNEERLSPDSRFATTARNSNQEPNLSVLTDLYLPLIGSNAFSLYMLLFGIAREDKYQFKAHSFYELQSILNLSLSDIETAQHKLEAVDLLSTSIGNEKVYRFAMHLPLSSAEFLRTDLLTTLLLGRVGSVTFKQLVQRVDQPQNDSKETQDISASLLDVFTVTKTAVQNPPKEVVELQQRKADHSRLSVNQQALKQNPFDFNLLIEVLSNSFIDIESVKTAYNAIIAEHLLYDIDEVTMSKLILKAVDLKNNQLDTDRLSQVIANDYQNATTGQMKKTVVQATKPVAKASQSSFDTQTKQIILIAQKTAPLAFLNQVKKQKGGFVSSNEQRAIRDLVAKDILPIQVINIMTYYVLVSMGNATVNKGLLEAIANDWAQKKVATAEDAIVAIKKRQEEQSQPKKNTRRQSNGRHTVKETLPDWAKRENRNKDLSSSTMTPEKAKKLKEKLDRLNIKKK
ncbi:DnaD domain protein [Lentilactobacillus sp. SPB1-3]|uniref:DnaD domain protein n=1 Tax=Lentilactobacillus terminaliae TaxID=3003483 RepID=A0ACD5DGS8_9LACO|nr:DnaD domain protein [Lentilactobacillus sp. SPB1-3]MCZ0977082.1 DnaD domain protein [Lentilactobacillus sp. SPB1-3]